MSAIEKFFHTIHEYERSKNNKDVYRCIHPRCTHYQRREFLVGKEARCAKCKEEFILTWRDLRAKKPVCQYCHESKKSRELKVAKEAAFSVLNELPDDLKQNLIDSTLE